jgi:hypothetical protein
MLKKLTIVQSNKKSDPSKHRKRTLKRKSVQRLVQVALESTLKTVPLLTIRMTERIRAIKRNP